MHHTTLLHSFLSLAAPPPPRPASGKGCSLQSSGGSFLELPKGRIALQAEGGQISSCSFVFFPFSSFHPIPVLQKPYISGVHKDMPSVLTTPPIPELFRRCDSNCAPTQPTHPLSASRQHRACGDGG